MKRTKFSGFGGTDPNDPNKKPVAKPVSTGPVYTPPNPKLSEEMNFQNASHNLGMALRFKNLLRGVNSNLIPSGDLEDLSQGTLNQPVGGGASAYTDVDQGAIMKADSVINAVRPMVLKKMQNRTGFKKGGSLDLSKLSDMF